MTEYFNHVTHPDDERYDRVTIDIAPRWKESELSGDGWRFSYVVRFWRKGEIILEHSTSRLEWLMQRVHLCFLNYPAADDKAFDREAWKRTEELCDQPGCAAEATVFFKRLKRYTRTGDELAGSSYATEYRQFCLQHTHRGDCALDDADHNYERIPNPRPKTVDNVDVLHDWQAAEDADQFTVAMGTLLAFAARAPEQCVRDAADVIRRSLSIDTAS